MEDFKRSEEAEARAEGMEAGPAFYALDKNRVPHFAMSAAEAAEKARLANQGYN